MGWIWAGLRIILDILNFLGIYQQDQQQQVIKAQHQIIKEGQDAEKKVLDDFGDQLAADAESLGLVRDDPDDPGGAAPK